MKKLFSIASITNDYEIAGITLFEGFVFAADIRLGFVCHSKPTHLFGCCETIQINYWGNYSQ